MTNPPGAHRPTTPFPVSGPADILAFIPHSLGFVPQESLVLMTVDATRLGATLRLDLPASALDYSGFAVKVSGILRSDTSATGVLMALYTDRDWKRPDHPPCRRLITQLSRSLTAAGLPIRDGWLISAHAWREYFCADSTCCPWPGHPLRDITNSTLSAEMVYRGSAYAASLEDAVHLDLPPAWERAGEAAVHRAAYARRLLGRWCGYAQFAATLAVWEAVAAAGGGGDNRTRGPESGGSDSGGLGPGAGTLALRADPETAGFLLASLRARPVRDSLLVMAALGRGPAVDGAAACNLLSRDARNPLLPPAPAGWAWNGMHQCNQGSGTVRIPGSGSGTGPDGPRQRAVTAGGEFRAVLVGQHCGAPLWAGMNAMFTVFAELLPVAEADGEDGGEAAAALLSLLAWIEWARGRGSRAQVYLTRCLASYPGYRLAELLEELLATGAFPEWARQAETAWKGAGHCYPGSASA